MDHSPKRSPSKPTTLEMLTPAQHALFMANRGLAHAAARKYARRWRGLDLEDAIQIALMALARCVQTHDPSRAKLSSYVFLAVRRDIAREGARLARSSDPHAAAMEAIVRPPTMPPRLDRLTTDDRILVDALAAGATRAELAMERGVSVERIRQRIVAVADRVEA